MRGLAQHWEPLPVAMVPRPVWEALAKGGVRPVAGSETCRLACWQMFLCSYALSWAFAVGGETSCLGAEWARTCLACPAWAVAGVEAPQDSF